MKKVVLMIIPAFICGIVFTGCGKADIVTQKNDLVFTNDDIISFNLTTGDIVFTKWKVGEIISHVDLYSEFNFLIEGYLPWHFEGGLTLKEQEENSKKRKKELEVLIGYLDKMGKIVE
jgi:hypothetical protein